MNDEVKLTCTFEVEGNWDSLLPAEINRLTGKYAQDLVETAGGNTKIKNGIVNAEFLPAGRSVAVEIPKAIHA